MVTIVALTSNNWSSTTNNDPWPGGTKPGSGDTVQTDEFVIEIDEDITVALLEATSTGYFSVAAISGGGTRTITADVLNSGSAVGALQIAAPTGNVVLVGSVTGGNVTGACGISNSGSMSLTGSVTGGGAASGVYDSMHGIYNTGTIAAFTGNVMGGNDAACLGIYNTGIITALTGDVTGGIYADASGIESEGTIETLDGNVTGGSAEQAKGIKNSGGTITELTGDVTGGAN